MRCRSASSRFWALPITFNHRRFYFADPDGKTLEINYELHHALELFPRAGTTRTKHCGQRTRRASSSVGARRLAHTGDAGKDRGATSPARVTACLSAARRRSTPRRPQQIGKKRQSKRELLAGPR